MRTSTRLLISVFAVVLMGAACGIPEDGNPRAVALPTATPETEAATPTPESTITATIYLTDDESRVRPAVREVATPPTLPAHIADLIAELLEDPNEEETELGLVSRIPAETMLFSDPEIGDDNTALVDFFAGGLETLEGEEATLAMAQLIWTLTESDDVDRVVVSIEGVAESWPTDGDDKVELARSDYRSFDPEFVEPTPEPEEPPTEEDPPPEETPGSDEAPADDTEPSPPSDDGSDGGATDG